ILCIPRFACLCVLCAFAVNPLRMHPYPLQCTSDFPIQPSRHPPIRFRPLPARSRAATRALAHHFFILFCVSLRLFAAQSFSASSRNATQAKRTCIPVPTSAMQPPQEIQSAAIPDPAQSHPIRPYFFSVFYEAVRTQHLTPDHTVEHPADTCLPRSADVQLSPPRPHN